MASAAMRARTCRDAVVYVDFNQAIGANDRNGDLSPFACTFNSMMYRILYKWLKRQIRDGDLWKPCR